MDKKSGLQPDGSYWFPSLAAIHNISKEEQSSLKGAADIYSKREGINRSENLQTLKIFYEAVEKDSGDPNEGTNAYDDECVGWNVDGEPMALTFKMMRDAKKAIAALTNAGAR